MISLKKDGLSAIGGLHRAARRRPARPLRGQPDRHRGLLHLRRAGRPRPGTARPGAARGGRPGVPAARAASTARLARMINEAGVDTVQPAGIHALYLNAGRLLPHLSPAEFPGHSLGCQLYLDGGIRCAELGSLYLGHDGRAAPAGHAGAVRAGPAGDPAPGLHRGALRVRGRRRWPTSPRTRSGCPATGSSRRRRCCATSRCGWQPAR